MKTIILLMFLTSCVDKYPRELEESDIVKVYDKEHTVVCYTYIGQYELSCVKL